MTDVTITRHDQDGSGEYHAHLEGEQAFGRLTWFDKDNVRVATHTLVPAEIGGRGVAARRRVMSPQPPTHPSSRSTKPIPSRLLLR